MDELEKHFGCFHHTLTGQHTQDQRPLTLSVRKDLLVKHGRHSPFVVGTGVGAGR